MKIDVKKLQSLLDAAVASGEECGCQLAVYCRGKLEADLCAGTTTPAGDTPVTPDSLFPVFSVGKAILSTAAHRLVEKGTLTYSTRLGDLWPEVDCAGKEKLLLWHILTHRGALFRDPEWKNYEELANWPLMCSRMAAMRPAWEPGTRCHYHPHTFAWLLGEPLSRADGRTLPQILKGEVIAPLGLEKEMYFGMDGDAASRIVPLDPSHFFGDAEYVRRIASPVIQKACIPSFNGIMSARAIAGHYAALDGEINGIRLLKPETVANASITRRAADDPVDPDDCWPRFGLGYVTFGFENDLSGLIGHGGAIGSEGLLDRRRHLALGFTKNRLNPRHPNHALRDRIAAELGLPVRHW